MDTTPEQLEFIRKHGITKCPPGRAAGSSDWAKPGSEKAQIQFFLGCEVHDHLKEDESEPEAKERRKKMGLRCKLGFPMAGKKRRHASPKASR